MTSDLRPAGSCLHTLVRSLTEHPPVFLSAALFYTPAEVSHSVTPRVALGWRTRRTARFGSRQCSNVGPNLWAL